jgi:hypothetical protein
MENQDERTQKLMRKIKEFSRQILSHLFTVSGTVSLVTTSSCNEIRHKTIVSIYDFLMLQYVNMWSGEKIITILANICFPLRGLSATAIYGRRILRSKGPKKSCLYLILRKKMPLKSAENLKESQRMKCRFKWSRTMEEKDIYFYIWGLC